ncbi:probable WRKY transcription factor 45 [Pyrus x bretschneideri]|uniref:probable WRKY transcription factor 45 n=1 Tax=Pyrus x bretschneideri TaxID=225117 RepID=UPI000510CBD4|nr:probable WRKY transcription factor 45 [Pyrus x bretschneideri]
MEKYQMFFPCSSSANYPNPNPTNTDHHHRVGSSHVYTNNFDGRVDQTSDAFLGLKSTMTTENHVGSSSDEVLVHKDGHPYQQYYQQHYPSANAGMSNVIVGADQSSVDPHRANNNDSEKKKKGEKKMKKPKYAFQTRSQVDILDDGYRWRKYGQKAVKANKFPRSYYRCTYEGCNVKKQVQRLSKDEGVVVTTYEGMHTHPIDKPSDNFEHILNQMQIYTPS